MPRGDRTPPEVAEFFVDKGGSAGGSGNSRSRAKGRRPDHGPDFAGMQLGKADARRGPSAVETDGRARVGLAMPGGGWMGRFLRCLIGQSGNRHGSGGLGGRTGVEGDPPSLYFFSGQKESYGKSNASTEVESCAK